jgi:tRNA(Arg) A34 adenosine deaminase TadA
MPILHAEVALISSPSASARRFDLGGEGLPACELVTSAEPQVMCFGAVLWSGVRRLVCCPRRGRTGHRLRRGPKPADWPENCSEGGETVVRDVCRDEAACPEGLRARRRVGLQSP